ncbi:hypothetical protein D3C72_2556670 [compost metagenome]
METRPALPRLVVTKTTPAPARAPYAAVVAASFKIEISSISLGLRLLNSAASMVTFPSIT